MQATHVHTHLQVAYPQKTEHHLGHFQEGTYPEESVAAAVAVVVVAVVVAVVVDLQLEQVLVVVAAQLVQGEPLVPLAVDIFLLVYPVCNIL